MGEKHVPEAIGTNTGPPYGPRRGHPVPREAKSHEEQLEGTERLNSNKNLKIPMVDKVRSKS